MVLTCTTEGSGQTRRFVPQGGRSERHRAVPWALWTHFQVAPGAFGPPSSRRTCWRRQAVRWASSNEDNRSVQLLPATMQTNTRTREFTLGGQLEVVQLCRVYAFVLGSRLRVPRSISEEVSEIHSTKEVGLQLGERILCKIWALSFTSTYTVGKEQEQASKFHLRIPADV